MSLYVKYRTQGGVRGCDIARGEAEGYITAEDTNRRSYILHIDRFGCTIYDIWSSGATFPPRCPPFCACAVVPLTRPRFCCECNGWSSCSLALAVICVNRLSPLIKHEREPTKEEIKAFSFFKRRSKADSGNTRGPIT